LDPLGSATVGCPNSAGCGGEVELELVRYAVPASDRSLATLIEARLSRQTCNCDHSEDDRDRLIDQAREMLGIPGTLLESMCFPFSSN
jgi:hypothetical protein